MSTTERASGFGAWRIGATGGILRGARLLLWLCLLWPPLLSSVQADGPEELKVANQVGSFYHWYVHTLNLHPTEDPATHARVEMKRYVTERLLRELERNFPGPVGLDHDYFLRVQQWDKAWEKNIVASSVKARDGRASAVVELTGPDAGRTRVVVDLVTQDGFYKIDHVKSFGG